MVFSRWFVYQDERKRRKTSKVSEISHVSEVSQVSQDSSGRLVAPVRVVKRDLEKPLPPLPQQRPRPRPLIFLKQPPQFSTVFFFLFHVTFVLHRGALEVCDRGRTGTGLVVINAKTAAYQESPCAASNLLLVELPVR
ncbi:hypothetical protein P167DRAFT_550127 [Morchella conica CCBAS932]|uniref:Uncharacterized protein n=1 Tax=Morchella conica CCBAS932 TaxID=1392247 RepID=A0A3N4K8X8_9PEZI|nr:hypothetical protein P167DRAFT_550127 [Morchella conica CCBAS932]